ncbi:Chemotaxis regulator - transmits chemoreceptor signals to flagelllar motor components CheY [Desulfovibrio sp. DV]|uniref:sensor histidine kinase n=1 Tax=Desulfovibrio sp. DV TaxID=1844708 RepID=UPI00094BB7B8|nr:HAMP domain-containing sensor histidine kinase [Desulfovibrio sp. DV]OLN27555.1 Chemotaxis regulator - transmits chemoreceptor signals to flagelllar motor components CheY [Desulfovibrio sp. DV]
MALSVKGKLKTLCGCIVAGFVLIFAVDVLENRSTERTLALERLAVTARIEALDMRRQEKNYFLRHDPEALAAVRRHQQAASAAIATIRTLDPDHDPLCDAALAHLQNYLTGFEAMAGSPGVAATTDPATRYLEASQTLGNLAALQPSLTAAIKHLERLEKRWLASGTPDAYKRLEHDAKGLRDAARAAPAPLDETDRVLTEYLAALDTYASRLEDDSSPRTGFVAAARALEPVTEELRASYQARRGQIVRTTSLIVAVIQIAVLILVALAAWGLYRFVASPLAELGRHARRVARGEAGDLDPDAYEGEFREVAADLARMERHLRDTINDLAAKEHEARQARKRAEDLSRVKSDFLSLVSHELKTPLTSMVGFAQVMRKRLERGVLAKPAGTDPEAVAEATRTRANLTIMLEEGRHLSGLIDNLLELAALESGDMPLALGVVPVDAVVDQAAADHAGAMAQKGLAFVRDIPDDFPLLRCDRERLLFVLGQLLSNAVKFTNSGHIACRVRHAGPMAVITVEDTGQGIPPNMREAVFEKFHQLSDVTTGKMPGLGIGLAASRAVVEHHGGTISIHDRPGGGVAVSITIPLVQAAP